MNVLIDASGIRRKKAGVGVYAKNLIDSLVQQESSLRYFIVALDDDSDFAYSLFGNVTILWLPSWFFRNPILRLLFEQLGLPFLLLRHRIDVIHSLHYSFPLLHFRSKQVVTLHDMTAFLLPSFHTPLKGAYFRFFIRAAMSLADAIVFVSQSSRRDCESLLGASCGKTFVVHHGIAPSPKTQAAHGELDRVRTRYRLPERFVLYIGTIEPRKNLRTLIRAFASLIEEHNDLFLVIAGMKGWNNEDSLVRNSVRELGLERRVLFPGYVSEKDKASLFSAASLFVYPSHYEGFGLPVLEAMAHGVPTVTSNTSSLREVAGDGALLVDPNDTSSLAAAMNSLLLDRALRLRLQELACLQVSYFTWTRAAAATMNVYSAVAHKPAEVITSPPSTFTIHRDL